MCNIQDSHRRWCFSVSLLVYFYSFSTSVLKTLGFHGAATIVNLDLLVDGCGFVHHLWCSSQQDYVSYGHGHRVMPAVWFRYELSPITVKYSEKRPPFYHFLTTVSAMLSFATGGGGNNNMCYTLGV